MGQEVAGLMFGVRVDDTRLYELIDDWKGVTLDARERYAQRFEDHDRYYRAERRFVPTSDTTGEAIGFFVAVPIHGREAYCLAPKQPYTMSQLRETKSYRRARRAWRRFAAWAEKERGQALPKAELILVMTEVG